MKIPNHCFPKNIWKNLNRQYKWCLHYLLSVLCLITMTWAVIIFTYIHNRCYHQSMPIYFLKPWFWFNRYKHHYNSPDSAILRVSLGFPFEPETGTASHLRTTNMLASSKTFPNTQCFPSSLYQFKHSKFIRTAIWNRKIEKCVHSSRKINTYQSHFWQVIKNWHPLVFGPLFAIDNNPAVSCLYKKFSSGKGAELYIDVLPVPSWLRKSPPANDTNMWVVSQMKYLSAFQTFCIQTLYHEIFDDSMKSGILIADRVWCRCRKIFTRTELTEIFTSNWALFKTKEWRERDEENQYLKRGPLKESQAWISYLFYK